MMNIEIWEEQKEWLIQLQKEYFTQDNRCTRTPIYLVQREVEYSADPDCGADGMILLDDNRDSDEKEIIRWTDGKKRDEEEMWEDLEEEIFRLNYLDKGSDDEKAKELQKKINEYFEENKPDINDKNDVIDMLEALVEEIEIREYSFQNIWETEAVCFTEQEAFGYKERQKHNLRNGRTYAVSPGYANYGHFSKLHDFVRDLRLLDDEGEIQLCRLGILNRMLRDEEKVKIEDIITCTNEIKTIVSIKRYSNEEEGKKDHIVFKDTNGENHYLYDIELNSLIRIRNYFYNN